MKQKPEEIEPSNEMFEYFKKEILKHNEDNIGIFMKDLAVSWRGEIQISELSKEQTDQLAHLIKSIDYVGEVDEETVKLYSKIFTKNRI